MKRKGEARESPAPLWRRVVAYLVDVLIVSMVVYVPLEIYALRGGDSEISFTQIVDEATKTKRSVEGIFVIIMGVVLTVAYFVVLEYKLQQTLGKMLMKIKVVSSGPLKVQQCIVRNITKVGSFILLLDCLYMFKSGHLRLFEAWSNTEVVQVESMIEVRKGK